VKKEEEDNSTPWKGKPSNFFVMNQKQEPSQDPQNPHNFDLTPDQWNFMFMHYPEYCAAPFEMMTWLHGQAKAVEM